MDWKASARVVRTDTVRRELLSRVATTDSPASVPVTDLIDLRPAYYRTRALLPPSRARRARQDAGRDLHVLLGRELAPPGQFEVRLQRDGVVGQLDWLDDGPTELKTTESPIPPEVEVAARTGYLDQLAMYCELANHPHARLLVVETASGIPRHGVALDVEYSEPDGIRAEMLRRVQLLREAITRGSPESLPRCEWFGRGCEFQQARACTCTGAESRGTALGEGHVAAILPNAEQTSRLNGLLPNIAAEAGRHGARRFRDLTYPRRVYFERRRPLPPDEAPEQGPPAARRGLFRSVREIVESGPGREVTRVPVAGEGVIETVSCLRGRPYLLKTTGVGQPYSPRDLGARQPQYLLELGLRCAALGQPAGWLIVAYERANSWDDRLDVFEVRFDPVEPMVAESRGRAAALAEALERDRPELAPPCPAWMFERCPYRDECACGAGGGGAVPGRNR